MKINLSEIDLNEFMMHPHVLFGETFYLIQPQFIGVHWTQRNKHFRSSLWDNEGELVSASFPKFVNWGENPDNFPVPKTLNKTNALNKEDGSTLICSLWKNNLISRTRGTSDASVLSNNGHELAGLLEKYNIKKALESYSVEGTSLVSFIFEWTSPFNKIVIDYDEEPKLFFIGAIYHADYSLYTQDALDKVAKEYDWVRPTRYDFENIEQMIAATEAVTDREGICLYSSKDQQIHKIKSLRYLALHRMKSELASLERVVDVFFTMDYPSFEDFYNYVEKTYDFEIARTSMPFISKVCNSYNEVKKIREGFDAFIEKNNLKTLQRKDAAKMVIDAYGNSNRSSMVFTRLDGKELARDQVKKLLYQVMKN